MQASFTNAFKFVYFLSPFNFMSSYIFIFHQSIWKMHLNFQIYSSTVNKFVLSYILSKKNVSYLPSKNKWCSTCQLSFTFAPCFVIYMLHTTSPWYTFCTEHFHHLQFDPIFHNLLSNLVDKEYAATQPCSR